MPFAGKGQTNQRLLYDGVFGSAATGYQSSATRSDSSGVRSAIWAEKPLHRFDFVEARRDLDDRTDIAETNAISNCLMDFFGYNKCIIEGVDYLIIAEGVAVFELKHCNEILSEV